ncbi:MAG: rRNA maturation RNase YbeY [Acidobacteriota bacterium]
MKVDVGGAAVPRLSRREIASFAQRVVRAAHGRIDELSIAFIDDATMRALNRKFRHQNKTTDVLTFPDEIVISLDQARRQARDEKHSLATEVRYLIAHGILHALGFDHETDGGEMNDLELRVRERVGLS